MRFTGPTARARRAKRSKDERYAAKVRAIVAERDGFCRVAKDAAVYGAPFVRRMVPCGGLASEWAHLGDKKRFKTRGLPPAERHTTAGSLMLCTRHHGEYDAGRLGISGNADADLAFVYRRELAVRVSEKD